MMSMVSVSQQKTYCNPINIDYGYSPIPNFSEWGRHRATADPVIVNYKGDYYLFSTNQWGYWWSSDMLNWKFISKKFLRPWNKVYDELCAPAIGIIGDTMLVIGSTYNTNFTIWMSTNPKANEWKPLVDSFEIGGWDPSFFTDDDGRLYLYNGSSNKYPMYGIELDRKTMKPFGTRKEMYLLEPWRFGWQRFGEHMDNTFLDPFIEGSHMTKHKGKYYLQYGAPGTEFSGYADGLLLGDSPLGPFEAASDPLSMKLGGFVRGAGHGATFQDNNQNYWHVSTTVISVKNTFERRLGIWPAGFDADDVMYCNTTFGDYPHFLPGERSAGSSYGKDGKSGYFTGWMLLNYNKPVQVSSTLGGYVPNHAVDELAKAIEEDRFARGDRDPRERLLEPERGELARRMGEQVDAQTDGTYLGSGFEHARGDSRAVQRERQGKAADPGADDRDFHAAMIPTWSRNGPADPINRPVSNR